MKNKKTLVIIIIIILLAICLLILVFNPFKKKSGKVNHYQGFTTFDGEIHDVCRDITNCKYPTEINYQTISYKTRDKNIKNIVDSYNQDIKKLYDKTVASALDEDSPCGEYTGVYYYQYISQVVVDLYVDEDFFIIANERSDYDLCADEVTPVKPQPVLYDLKKKKIITQEEFRNRLNINDDVIRKSINAYLKERDLEGVSVNYEDVSVYYNGEYGLLVAFLIDGKAGYSYTKIIMN